jgi:hypothetical protein
VHDACMQRVLAVQEHPQVAETAKGKHKQGPDQDGGRKLANAAPPGGYTVHDACMLLVLAVQEHPQVAETPKGKHKQGPDPAVGRKLANAAPPGGGTVHDAYACCTTK